MALANPEGCQVHSDNIFGAGGSFFSGVNQSASENSLYKISINFRVQQWNESQWTNCNDNPAVDKARSFPGPSETGSPANTNPTERK